MTNINAGKINLLSKDVLTEETKGLIIPLLDYFAASNNLVVAIYNANGKEFWSNQTQYFSPMCSCIKKHPTLWSLCKKDHAVRASSVSFDSKSEPKLSICHLGLWNIAYPIYHDEIYYGALMAGQKKIISDDKELKSKNKFEKRINELVKEGQISEEVEKLLKEKFNLVPQIENFPGKSLETLALIEKSLIDIIKNLLKRIKKITLLRHELHQPNTAARGILIESKYQINELIKNKNIPTNEKKDLHKILQNLNYSIGNSFIFSTIIENICSSLSEDEQVLISKKCCLLKMIEDTMQIFQSPAGEKSVIFSPIKKISIDTPYIYGSKSLLMRVLINLYHNAVKYSYYGQSDEEPRRIDTTCRNLKKYFEISIANYGLGILHSEIEKVWLDEYRGELSCDRHRTGSGFGLYQVDQIIRLHKGKRYIESVSIRNRNDALGPFLTTVTIRLPYDFNLTGDI